MARKYHTLCIREDGIWAPQFGDYSREVVEQERDDHRDSANGYKAKDMRIITSGDTQAAINAAVAKLNAKAAPAAEEGQ